MTTTEEDVAVKLASVVVFPGPAGVGELVGPVALVFDENCRIGPIEPKDTEVDGTVLPGGVPGDLCVWVLESGGFTDEAHKGGDQADPFNWPGVQRPTCQVIVRSAPNNYADGKALADVVARALDKNPAAGYFEQRVRDGRAWYVRENDEDDHEWSINLELKRYVPQP